MAPGMAALVRLSQPNIPRSFKAAGDFIRPGPIRPSINTLAGATIGVTSAGCRCPAIFPVIRNVYTRMLRSVIAAAAAYLLLPAYSPFVLCRGAKPIVEATEKSRIVSA